MANKKEKGQNKRISELKHGILYMAEQLGTESKLRKVFDIYEKSFYNGWCIPEQQIRMNLYKIALAQGSAHELQVAVYHFDRLPRKRPNEQETREKILATGILMGVPKEDILAIFSKYDNLLKNASSEKERQDISNMGAAEIHRLLGIKGALIVNGKEIIPADPSFKDNEKNHGKFIKLD